MKIDFSDNMAYIDCSSGISGDMMLGGLVSLGLPLEVIESELKRLHIHSFSIEQKVVLRAGIEAMKVDVVVDDSSLPARTWADVQGIIQQSDFSQPIKSKGLAMFRRIFEAEAKVHGKPFDRVHLHELAAVDCLVDVFGALIGLDAMGVREIHASSVNVGAGTVKTSHGVLPVPVPATAELLQGVPVYSDNTPFELTTPTGALLVSSLATQFGPMPKMQLQAVGYGAGGRDIHGKPNVLRIFSGKPCDSGFVLDSVVVVETNIDDMEPRLYEPVIDSLFAAHALDVFLTPIIMKKSRPAIKLTVLVEESRMDTVCEILLKETTTFGVRFYSADRQTLEREIKAVDTIYGPVRVKFGKLNGQTLKAIPEYEDMKAVAASKQISVVRVIDEVERAINQQE
ncbi:MAG TPA: nickel pincer cofactor biosynthesis protein LarC [Thermodesulfovibrionia bacterium]|nr:nickel pincer cofactor biosynthesis protein LarC [Thermodesulfovibrionia bacterium]